ncbi:MAG: InlB B-repeat-containing protein, partial [Candidatus Ventricola sp.]
MKKTILCLLLTLGLLLLSAAAMAVSRPEDYSFDITEGDITIEDAGTSEMVKVTYGNGNPQSTTDAFDPQEQEIAVVGGYHSNSPQLSIQTTEPVKIRYGVMCEDIIVTNIIIADNADVTLIPDSDPCDVSGAYDFPGIELGSGSKLTIQAEYPNRDLRVQGVQSAILGLGSDETPATVILNSGKVWFNRLSGSGISGNVNLVINGGRLEAYDKNINVQNLIVTGGELWAGSDSSTKVTYQNLRNYSNQITCTAGILPYDEENYDSKLVVFGDLTLPDDLTIPTGKTLTVPEGKTLTIPEGRTLTVPEGATLTIPEGATLDVRGCLTVNGDLILNGDLKVGQKGTVRFSVKLDAGMGTIASGKDVGYYTYGVGATLPGEGDVTRTGYKFAGWYDNADCTGDAVSEIDKKAIGVKKYWAKWNARYNVKLHPNGGTIISGDVDSYTHGEGATLPSEVTRSGYTFAGWFADKGLTDGPVWAIDPTETGDKTFWAGWIAAPVITSPTENRTVSVYEGDQATMTVSAEHAAAYQWYMSTDGGKSWAECGGNSPT